MSDAPLTVAAFAGSLREKSYNKMLLRAAGKLAPPGMRIETIDISQIPLYNADLEPANTPPSVRAMREAIRAADALLIVTPEYNYSFSGVTKNVIDWASRPPDDSCLNDKPTAIAGASAGGFGTVRAQLHLRHVAVETNMWILNEPEMRVARAWQKFDDAGALTDEDVAQELRELLVALAAWTRRLKV
ncbi:MAG TPA: NADPH-dependent FMN reductase [Candidatus Tumulicola sp.]|nr:NADPH-dependent FMN reductase [Candidatus Tumulicola sp.]